MDGQKKVESNREDIRGQPKSHCQKKGDIFNERIIQFGFWYSILIPFRADTTAHDGITLKSGKVVSELKRRPSHTKTRKKTQSNEYKYGLYGFRA